MHHNQLYFVILELLNTRYRKLVFGIDISLLHFIKYNSEPKKQKQIKSLKYFTENSQLLNFLKKTEKRSSTQAISPFPTLSSECFQKSSAAGASESVYMWERVNLYFPFLQFTHINENFIQTLKLVQRTCNG